MTIPNLIFKRISFVLVIKSYDVITTVGSIISSLVLDITYNPVTGTLGILKIISSSHVYLMKSNNKYLLTTY